MKKYNYFGMKNFESASLRECEKQYYAMLLFIYDRVTPLSARDFARNYYKPYAIKLFKIMRNELKERKIRRNSITKLQKIGEWIDANGVPTHDEIENIQQYCDIDIESFVSFTLSAFQEGSGNTPEKIMKFIYEYHKYLSRNDLDFLLDVYIDRRNEKMYYTKNV
jgi:hypothetical protein